MAGTIERDLATLEQGITVLRINYERFFAGDLKMPPMAERRKIEDGLKKVGNADVERAAERFRLQGIQSRYTALSELWDKRLQAREQGMRPGFRPPPSVAAPGARGPSGGDVRPAASVKGKRRIDLTPLFERYCAARRALGQDVSKLRYERFEELVKKQAAEIRRTTGTARLVFEIQTLDGRVRLIGRAAPASKGTQ
jgi:hypothetical protein